MRTACYHNPDPATNEQFPTINYFVLEGNTLTITPDKGILKNDIPAPYVQYLTAHQLGDGEYGHFDIQSHGGFTYTPYSWVFEDPNFAGLEDTCEYFATDPTGRDEGVAEVKVDLADVVIQRVGQNSNKVDPWIGGGVTLSMVTKGVIQGAPLTFAWTIPGKSLESQGTGEHVPDPLEVPSYRDVDDVTFYGREDILDPDDLTQASVKLYWADPGGKATSVIVTAAGQTKTDSLSFNVKDAPDPVAEYNLSVTTGEVQLNGNVLSLGSFSNLPTSAGWRGANDPSMLQTAHAWGFKQTVNSVDFSITLSDGSKKKFVLPGIALDGAAAGDGHLFGNSIDTPAITLRSNWRKAVVSEQFTLYQMFKPGDFSLPGNGVLDSIFVPVLKADWGWNGTAESTNGATWTLTASGGSQNTNLSFEVCHDMPLYEFHIAYWVPMDGNYFDDRIFSPY